MNDLFPHEKVRDVQSELLKEVGNAVEQGKDLIAHAPTGLGKTAAVIAPALSYALKNNMTVFFLTSRHMQHVIAVDTLKQIIEKHKKKFTVADIIGKRWMCAVEGIEGLYSKEFSEYCRAVREDQKCEFYNNTYDKTKPSLIARRATEDLTTAHSEKIVEYCSNERICPYEIAVQLSKKASVVIADYNYMFNSHIRIPFLKKSNKEMAKSIIIVDEGHNVPQRVRELMTERLSTVALDRAIKEAEKFKYKETRRNLIEIRNVLDSMASDVDNEKAVTKEEFIEQVEETKSFDQLIADFEFIGDEVRERQKQSYIGAVGLFLDAWQGDDKGFVRIISVMRSRFSIITLSYRCLDPSLTTKEVVNEAHSTIIMSGTLTPTRMYRDLLGFPEDTIEKTYKSPFPEKNKLTLVVPETTTKFSRRNEEQYKKIADITADMVNSIPGNTFIFFPSYYLRDSVNKFFSKCTRTVFLEQPNMKKSEKKDMLDRFKKYKDATMLAVVSGNFGEGVDIPGNLLKGVIVVGLPLQKPDIETNALIEYYDKKFKKGWDYGYLHPGFNKALQSAGRCIRSETDKGVLVFLDERYSWQNYFKCFPADWDIKITKMYKERIDEFFRNSDS
ncbi:MAG: ATP-dependent DNA helicase [bacterium]|nr:ATP-dependent DNA helicase [bacterium]